MKKLASLGISLVLVGAAIGVPSSRPAAVAAQSRAAFQVEEATIAGIHAAITSGQTTCRGVVQAYVDRAKAYNGVCTALVTADGADIAPAKATCELARRWCSPPGPSRRPRYFPT